MKRMKKFASILLAMVMVLSMGLTAFAAADDGDQLGGTVSQPTENPDESAGNGEQSTGDGAGVVSSSTEPTDSSSNGETAIDHGNFTITINDTTENYVYEAYQIFKGNLNVVNGVKTLSNIEWGSGVDSQKVATEFPGKTAKEVAETLAGTATSNEHDTEAAKKFAEQISECLVASTDSVSRPKMETVDGKEVLKGYEITGLTVGYYLVQNKSVPTVNGSYTRYMMEVVGDVSAVPKRDIPKPDKKIVEKDTKLSCTEDHEHTEGCYTETEEKVEANEASIGDEVEYEITGTMPSNIADYKTYYYKFTDTLSKGLTYKEDSIKVTVNGVDVTKYFWTKVGEYNETTGTTIEVAILDVKALSLLTTPAPQVGEITKDTKIVLTYTATLNEEAVIADTGNPNDVKLTYSNDPNKSGVGAKEPPKEKPEEPEPTHPRGESPKVTVVTYTTELTIKKTDEEDNWLPGVEFTLTGSGVNVVLVTEEEFTLAENGTYWKLKDGTYTTEAPTEEEKDPETGEIITPGNTDDYQSTTDKYTKTEVVNVKGNGDTKTEVVGTVQMKDGTVTFTGLGAGDYTITETKTLPGYNTIEPIKFTLTFDKESKEFSSNNDKVSVGTDNMLDTSIINYKGSLLPSTGGIGTTIFYVVGAILVIGAGILLVAKKRMSSK